ncbi:MAG: hypothetical protein Q4G68_08635 [Planctomycetia bacterium]|nr:hypothetical protein [Planctomycetia bacterium]
MSRINENPIQHKRKQSPGVGPGTLSDLEERLRTEWPDYLFDEEARQETLIDAACHVAAARSVDAQSRSKNGWLAGGIIALLLLAVGLLLIPSGIHNAGQTGNVVPPLALRSLTTATPTIPELDKLQPNAHLEDVLNQNTKFTTPVPSAPLLLLSPEYVGYLATKKLTETGAVVTAADLEEQAGNEEQKPDTPLTLRYGETIIKDVMESNPITSYVMDYYVAPVFFDP